MSRTTNTLFDVNLLGGGTETGPVNVSAAYVMQPQDNWVRCTQSGAYAVTLPPTRSLPVGSIVTVGKVDTSAFAVTLTGAGLDLINGSATNATALPASNYAVARLRVAALNVWDLV
jgi:hypothetical protein